MVMRVVYFENDRFYAGIMYKAPVYIGGNTVTCLKAVSTVDQRKLLEP